MTRGESGWEYGSNYNELNAMRQLFINFVTLLATGLVSCKEPLPEYNDPRDVFDSYLSSVYVCSPTENATKIFLVFVNKYEETLDGEALLTGRLAISRAADRTFQKTVTIGPSNIVYARGYNAATGVLSIDPGDSVRLLVSWNLVADDGRSLRDEIHFMNDPTCPRRLISIAPVPLIITGNMSVYERTETVTPKSLRYEFTLIKDFVSPRDC